MQLKNFSISRNGTQGTSTGLIMTTYGSTGTGTYVSSAQSNMTSRLFVPNIIMWAVPLNLPPNSGEFRSVNPSEKRSLVVDRRGAC